MAAPKFPMASLYELAQAEERIALAALSAAQGLQAKAENEVVRLGGEIRQSGLEVDRLTAPGEVLVEPVFRETTFRHNLYDQRSAAERAVAVAAAEVARCQVVWGNAHAETESFRMLEAAWAKRTQRETARKDQRRLDEVSQIAGQRRRRQGGSE